MSGHARTLWSSIILCCLLSHSAVLAANPTLFAERNGIDDESRKRPLPLAALRIDVTIEGSIAATTLTADFSGIPHETLEGHFSLALPEGAIVNGYALDIDDQMIEGTLLPRPKARDVYESKVRKSIDPGLAEVSSSNVFSTKVFPILAETGRTIRVSFVAPVHRGLLLPLATEHAVESIDVRVRARDVHAAPALTLPFGMTPAWQRTREGWVAAASIRSANLQGALALGPTTPRRTALVSQDREGQRFFQIRDSFRPGFSKTVRPERIRVYWDASLSRRDDKLAEEIALLERYLQFAAGVPVDLVIFNSTTAEVLTAVAPASIKPTLDQVAYRGGTSFAVIDGLRLPDAEVCVLFSDGAATIDRRDTFRPDCTIKAVASAPDADGGYLMHLIREHGGALIKLGIDTADEAHRRLIDSSPALVSATTADGKPLAFNVIENDANGWFVVGEAPRVDEIVLQFRGRRGRTFDMRYGALKLPRARFDGAAVLWASEEITRLAVEEAEMKDVERVSRRYSVASPSLAFVVLETPEDYAHADIVPPKSYPKEGWEEYAEAKRSIDEERLADRASHLEDLVDAWEARKEWWDRPFDPRAKPARLPLKRAADRFRSARGATAFGGRSGGGTFVGGGLEEIIVTGMLIRPSYQEVPIVIEAMSMDRPYLRALEGSAPHDAAALLAAQEKDHGQFPAFYLDTAEWLYRQDQVTEASEMLLSALELPLSNDETKAIVADRLLRYGYIDRAIWLYEQTARIASHRPQPKMQLALALAKRASLRSQTAKRDLQRAIALLNDVAVTSWDGAYEGVALAALTEANALIARLKRNGGGRIALAPELVALLDLDVRVVIQWNTAATDVDLWIDEPNGERAIYSNPSTAIGGLLSDDMTEGYGPEEYLLRRAGPGEYRVYIDVYAPDSINPNGATTVTARLIHDFGRPTEREEMIDVELRPDESGERFVGAIRVGGGE